MLTMMFFSWLIRRRVISFVAALDDESGVAYRAFDSSRAREAFFQPLEPRVGVNQQQIEVPVHQITNLVLKLRLIAPGRQDVAQAAYDFRRAPAGADPFEQRDQLEGEFPAAEREQLNDQHLGAKAGEFGEDAPPAFLFDLFQIARTVRRANLAELRVRFDRRQVEDGD